MGAVGVIEVVVVFPFFEFKIQIYIPSITK